MKGQHNSSISVFDVINIITFDFFPYLLISLLIAVKKKEILCLTVFDDFKINEFGINK